MMMQHEHIPAAGETGQAQAPERCRLALGSMIDHTLLRADATEADVLRLCDEAARHNFASVCVHGCHVAACAARLAGSEVKGCTVVGFPLGAMSSDAKLYEAVSALEHGAREVDMVINVGALKCGSLEAVRREIGQLAAACHERGALLKVIIETALLDQAEKILACRISAEAGADFVKTSTGFSKGGATVEDVALMRRTVGPEMGVKASGGIRDTETALAMIAAGANRLGTSASVAIVTGANGGGAGY